MDNDCSVYDIDAGINLAGGNQKLALELINMLIAQLPNTKTEINSLLNDGNMTSLKQCLHKLHGSSQCCATPELVATTQSFEAAIDSQQTEQLETEKSNLFSAIDKILQLDTNSI